MHLFLTGVPGVGKSTLLRTILTARPDLHPGGFRTYTFADRDDAIGSVYIAPFGQDAPTDAAHRIGIRWGRGKFSSYPAVFETVGAEILFQRAGFPLLIMDEVGKMEGQSPRFCRALLEALDGTAPVLGVIKPISTPLLDAIRARQDVAVWTVTEQNRNTLVEPGQRWLAQALQPQPPVR